MQYKVRAKMNALVKSLLEADCGCLSPVGLVRMLIASLVSLGSKVVQIKTGIRNVV